MSDDVDLQPWWQRLYDLALAAGLDAGRYLIITNPADPESGFKVARGPNFDQAPAGDVHVGRDLDEHIVWMQQLIDKGLRELNGPSQ